MGTGSNPKVVWLDKHNLAELKTMIANSPVELDFRQGIFSYDKESIAKFSEKIEKFCSEISPSLSTKEKIAYVNYNIHKLVKNYTLDADAKKNFDLETGSNNYLFTKSPIACAIYGEGVCFGIADLVSFILNNELKIKCKTILVPGVHAFNIAECEEGSILLDATWDLSLCELQAYPTQFGKSQEDFTKVRSHQFVADEVKDFKPIIEIPEKEKRAIHTALGLADNDGYFPAPLGCARIEVAKKFKEGQLDETQALLSFLETMQENLPKEYVQTRMETLDSFLLTAGIEGKTMYLYDKSDHSQVNSQLTFITREKTFLYDSASGKANEISNEELLKNFAPHSKNHLATQSFGKMFATQEKGVLKPNFAELR